MSEHSGGYLRLYAIHPAGVGLQNDPDVERTDDDHVGTALNRSPLLSSSKYL
jgi:hypothetical protein